MRGLSTTRELDALISHATRDPYHHVPRAVIIVSSPTSPLYVGPGGYSTLPPYTGSSSDLEKGERINEGSIFEMYSCTKLITVIAAMQCFEKGLFELEDNAEDWVKELERMRVLERWDGEEPVLRTQERKITMRMLLNHTAGFVYPGYKDEKIKRYVEKLGFRKLNGPEFTREVMASIPLGFQPGEERMYGFSTDWLGFAVEAMTGLDLASYFDQHIFKPLNIEDISFFPPPNKIPMAFPSENGDGRYTFRRHRDFSPPNFFGGAGLSGSPQSYMKILQLLLNGGVSTTGARVLKESTVEMLFEGYLAPDKQRELEKDSEAMDLGKKWTFAGQLTPRDLDTGRKEGTLDWSGAANTQWFVDPTSKIAMLVWGNSMDYSPSDFTELYRQAETLVYRGLAEST